MLKIALTLSVLALPLSSPGAAYGGEEDTSSELKVLYAGDPGGPREKVWTEFLRESFATVDTISLKDLDAASAANHDVVVADWIRRYEDGNYKPDARRHGTTLSGDFRKPIIMISAVGGELTRPLSLKINWM